MVEVERWRGGFRRAYRLPALSFGRCLNSLAVLRLHLPPVEPDVRISRIRLSDKAHAFAHGTVVPAAPRLHATPALVQVLSGDSCPAPASLTLCFPQPLAQPVAA